MVAPVYKPTMTIYPIGVGIVRHTALPGPTISNILSYPAQRVTGRYEETVLMESAESVPSKGIRFKNSSGLPKPKNNIFRPDPSQKLPPVQPIVLNKRPTPPRRVFGL